MFWGLLFLFLAFPSVLFIFIKAWHIDIYYPCRRCSSICLVFKFIAVFCFLYVWGLVPFQLRLFFVIQLPILVFLCFPIFYLVDLSVNCILFGIIILSSWTSHFRSMWNIIEVFAQNYSHIHQSNHLNSFISVRVLFKLHFVGFGLGFYFALKLQVMFLYLRVIFHLCHFVHQFKPTTSRLDSLSQSLL